MKQRKLGSQGLLVCEPGLGCMGMSDFYGPRDDAESAATIDRSLELGVTFIDTSDAYGPHRNEELVGRVIRGRRDRFVVATKFGIVRDASDPARREINGRPEYVRSACEASLRRLGAGTIDLYYQHRVDPKTPIEDTVGEMAKLVTEGKVRYLGLSKGCGATIRRAHKVHPISALQSEYSLWTRDLKDGILATCRELGIGLVAYSPLGRGFLTGKISKFDDLALDDFRRFSSRFQGANFDKNLQLLARIGEIAKEKNCTPGQLGITSVLARGTDIVPIPGTKRRKYLEENVVACAVKLRSADLKRIDEGAPKGAAAGPRYPEARMSSLNL